MKIVPADPREPGPAGTLAQSCAMMQAMYPYDQNHLRSPDALAASDIRVCPATEDEAPLGIDAIGLRKGHAAVKSLFTAHAARRLGMADDILRRLIDAERIEAHPVLRLESGAALDAAHRLCLRHGPVPHGPSGDRAKDAGSLFSERPAEPPNSLNRLIR